MKLRQRRARFVRNPRRHATIKLKAWWKRASKKLMMNSTYGKLGIRDWMKDQLLDEYRSGLDSVVRTGDGE